MTCKCPEKFCFAWRRLFKPLFLSHPNHFKMLLGTRFVRVPDGWMPTPWHANICVVSDFPLRVIAQTKSTIFLHLGFLSFCGVWLYLQIETCLVHDLLHFMFLHITCIYSKSVLCKLIHVKKSCLFVSEIETGA